MALAAVLLSRSIPPRRASSHSLFNPAPPAAGLTSDFCITSVPTYGRNASGTTTAKDRKRLLRTLIADVTLLPEPDRSKVRIGIRWHAGTADELTATRPIH